MFRLLIYVAAGYFIYRGIKSLMAPGPDKTQVKGKSPEKKQTAIDRDNIEDAKFKDVDE